VWSLGVTLAGYGLGSSIPSIDKYLLPIIALIVIVSLSPLAVELLRRRRAGASQPGPGTRPDSAARPDAVSQPDSVWRPDPESRPFPTSRPSPRSDSAAASHARHAASEDY
jgi:hypothetical protein